MSRKSHPFVDCIFISDHGRDPKVLLKEIPEGFGKELTTISHMVMGVDSIVGKILKGVEAGGYSALSWVRMCGPKFRPPPYNKTREDANLLPISKPFVS